MKDFEAEENREFIQELHFLNTKVLKNLSSNTGNIKLRTLCVLSKLNEATTVEELLKLGPAFKVYSQREEQSLPLNSQHIFAHYLEQEPEIDTETDNTENGQSKRHVEWKMLQNFFSIHRKVRKRIQTVSICLYSPELASGLCALFLSNETLKKIEQVLIR